MWFFQPQQVWLHGAKVHVENGFWLDKPQKADSAIYMDLENGTQAVIGL